MNQQFIKSGLCWPVTWRKCQINVGENRRGSQECTILRHWEHWSHKSQNDDKENTTQHLYSTCDNRNIRDRPKHLHLCCLLNCPRREKSIAVVCKAYRDRQ